MAYCESEKMRTSRCLGAISMARRMAVNSARWFVWRGPESGSERLLGFRVSKVTTVVHWEGYRYRLSLLPNQTPTPAVASDFPFLSEEPSV